MHNLNSREVLERCSLLLEIPAPVKEFEDRNDRTCHLSSSCGTSPELHGTWVPVGNANKDVCINERSFYGRHGFPIFSLTAGRKFARQRCPPYLPTSRRKAYPQD